MTSDSLPLHQHPVEMSERDIAEGSYVDWAAILARSVVSGEMAERDRSYLAQLVAANTDLDRTAARTRVDEVNAELANARAQAVEHSEIARYSTLVA